MFNLCKIGGANSLLEFRNDKVLEKHWTSQRKDIQYSGISYEVETTRLDTFIEEYGLQDRTIDYLYIDAQGVDLQVLQSLGKYIKNVKEGVLETVKDPQKSIYTNQLSTLATVENFLNENGFKITKVENNDPTNFEFNVYFSQ
jgi:hypothetical protein